MRNHVYFRFLHRNIFLLISAALLGCAVGSAVSLLQPPTYSATSQVFISLSQASDITDLSQGSTFAQQAVKSYSAVASSPAVLDPVINKLKLEISYDGLVKKVSVDNPLNTVILEITVDYSSPRAAASVANSISEQLATVVQQLTPSAAGATSSPVTVSQIARAQPPATPSSPRVILNAVAGFWIGAALGFITALLRTRLDVRIRSRSDIEDITTLPTLGQVGYSTAFSTCGILALLQDNREVTDSYNQLQTSLAFFGTDKDLRIIQVASALAGEGKTTTAIGLAHALATSGRNTVLLDCDLRRPRVADYCGIDGAIGLTNALLNEVEIQDAAQIVASSGLAVIPAGTIPPNPLELLQSSAMSTFLQDLLAHYDTIILDAPPVLAAADARVLANQAHAVLFVASARSSKKTEVVAALDLLSYVQTSVIGVTLTMSPSTGPDAYSSYQRYSYSGQIAPAGVPATPKPSRPNMAE